MAHVRRVELAPRTISEPRACARCITTEDGCFAQLPKAHDELVRRDMPAALAVIRAALATP